MVDIENLKINYFSNEEPVPYKVKTGKELKIYPITVKEYPVYESCKSVLEIKKETVNNAEVIQMSYLRFLTDIASIFGWVYLAPLPKPDFMISSIMSARFSEASTLLSMRSKSFWSP